MTKNFKLVIEYDGSAYHGWQKQNHNRTIQGEIEKVIETITREKVNLIGSGRTDTGVHAYGQVASFLSHTRHSTDTLKKGINSLLPDDIVIRTFEEVDIDFHAQFNAIKKTYHYKILNANLPVAIGRRYAWFIRRELNLKAMQDASRHLAGTHDFKSFESVGSPRTHTTRCITKAHFSRADKSYLLFEVEANGFLRHMVRNIVGTLVEVGLGRITDDGFKEILLSRDRRNAGPTAPPHGLFLMHVDYESETVT